MLSQLTRSDRRRLEAEIEGLLSRLGSYQRDPSRIERLAKEIDQGRILAGGSQKQLWAALLRRRAMCIRTAMVASQTPAAQRASVHCDGGLRQSARLVGA